MSIEESCDRVLNSLDRLELALLRQWHAEEEAKRIAAETKARKLSSQVKNLQHELSFRQDYRPREHDAHSESRSHYYIPDPVKNPRHP